MSRLILKMRVRLVAKNKYCITPISLHFGYTDYFDLFYAFDTQIPSTAWIQMQNNFYSIISKINLSAFLNRQQHSTNTLSLTHNPSTDISLQLRNRCERGGQSPMEWFEQASFCECYDDRGFRREFRGCWFHESFWGAGAEDALGFEPEVLLLVGAFSFSATTDFQLSGPNSL